MMRKLLLLVVLTLNSLSLFATEQMPEKLWYKGRMISLYNVQPMEYFFEKFSSLRPNGNRRSTALYRQYIGTYEIIDSCLVLKDIEVEIFDDSGDKEESVFKQIFPTDTLLKISWVSKLFIIPYGEASYYNEETLESKSENYLILQFENGKLTKEKDFNRKEFVAFREQQFKLFKKTAKYEELKLEHINRAKTMVQYRNSKEFKASNLYKREKENNYVWVDPYSKHPIDYFIMMDMFEFDNLEKLLEE